MVDPTSDLGEGAEDDAPACATCGDSVSGTGRRVTTRVEDGRVVHRHFCSDECLDAFESS
ncbi:MAG: hypothetical protein ABEJ22_00275 [Haloferacaceae archaeon]